ncbi:MAG: hypothetical protein KGZ25_02030 [Planctomycetes bacterium]|nr:hypothetical protein [Planctomycetota bacterium]
MKTNATIYPAPAEISPSDRPFLVPSQIRGHSEEHPVENVTFENLTVGGDTIMQPDGVDLTIGEYVRNVRFETRNSIEE